MTIIAAAVTTTGVVMAADRQSSTNHQKIYNQMPKLWTTEKFALGVAGDLRVAQVLKHHVSWPKYRPDEDTDWEAYLVKTVVPAIRAGVKDQGVVKTENGVESIEAGLLIAAGRNLATVYGDNCISVDMTGRFAIGSGYAEALGRLGDEGPWTETDVVDAVRRAIITARGCSGPISVVDTDTLEVRTVEK